MADSFGATFSARDMVALTDALIEAAPYARGTPSAMRRKLVPAPVVANWRAELLAKADSVSVEWGPRQTIIDFFDGGDWPIGPEILPQLARSFSFDGELLRRLAASRAPQPAASVSAS